MKRTFIALAIALPVVALAYFAWTIKKSVDSKFEVVSQTMETTKPLAKKDSLLLYDSSSTFTCEHEKLSDNFDLKVTFHRKISTKHQLDDLCHVEVVVIDKPTKRMRDILTVDSAFFLSQAYMDCNSIRSYTTNYNSTMQEVDNYYGDVVVADFNFDNREDIALSNDSGGNGGTFYSFYLQGPDKKFKLDKFLTDSMTYFPTTINNKEQALTTYVHAGACYMDEDIFRLDQTTNHWIHQRHRSIDVCKDKSNK